MAAGVEVSSYSAEFREELFYQAITEGDVRKVRRLLPPSDGSLPELSVHIAANSPSRDVLELLLQLDRLDVDGREEESMLSPLHVAAMYGREDLVEVLLGYGADPFVVDGEGCTPVDHAHINGHNLCASALTLAMSSGEVSVDDGNQTMSLAYVTMMEADSSDVVKGMAAEVTPSATAEVTVSQGDDTEVTQGDGTEVTQGNDTEVTQGDGTEVTQGDDVEEVSLHIPECIQQLSNDAIRKKLASMGDNPGPINDGNRPLYLRYLARLEAGEITRKQEKQGYRYELALCLAGVVPMPALYQLEKELEASLGTLLSLSRSRGCSSFNYLLLDPRAVDSMSPDDGESGCFLKFIEGVFYVGKGKNARPLQHLLEARKSLQLKDKKHPPSDKCARIHSIWSSGRGVVSLHCFHCISSEEAHTREACMLDAIGLSNLTNQVKGVSYGAAKRWQPALRRKFGVFLLYRAMKVLLADGLREIYPSHL